MADPSRETVTRLLDQMEDGGRLPVDQLFDRVYDELRVLARRQRRRWRGDHTLDTTALIHEAYLKLVDGSRVGAGSRAHFFALASKAMRHVLCNYAREKCEQKNPPLLEVNSGHWAACWFWRVGTSSLQAATSSPCCAGTAW